MANTTYSEKLLNPLWQKKRLEILNRDKFTCTLCGDDRTTLAIHHLEYKGKPWEVENDKLKTVCLHCHDVIHKLPNFSITKVIKEQDLTYRCWRIVAFTETEIVFLYMFFTDVENRSSLPNETIIIHTNLKAA